MKKYLKYIITSSIVLTIILVDMIAKIIVVSTLKYSDPVKIMGDFLVFELSFNTGVAFSGLEKMPSYVLGLISLAMSVVLGFMIYKYSNFKTKIIGSIALALMLGGALGNMIDRFTNFPAMLYNGPLPLGTDKVGVVDFINTKWMFDILHLPNGIWNIADGCLVVGTIALMVHILFFEKDEKKKKKEEKVEVEINENSSTESEEANG